MVAYSILLITFCLFAITLFSRNLFWRFFPLLILLPAYTATHFLQNPFSLSGFLAWTPFLLVSALSVLQLSPLQLLPPREERSSPRRIKILYDPKDKERVALLDIVAVHGLGSSAKRAWVHKATGCCWLRQLLPEAMPEARIMAFNHDSDWSIYAPRRSLYDYGLELLMSLENSRKSDEEKGRPVIFIGHSFGGVIIKRVGPPVLLILGRWLTRSQALVTASNERNPLWKHFRGVIYLGTPHHGSPTSRLGSFTSLNAYWVGPRTELLEFLEPGCPGNAGLNREYLKAYPDIYHSDFFELQPERLPILGISTGMPVPKEYAVLVGPKTREVPLNTSHRGMNKFPTADENYSKVRDELVYMWEKLEGKSKPIWQAGREILETKEEQRLSKLKERRDKLDTQRARVLAWLNHASFHAEDTKHDRMRTDGTCGWVCESEEYRRWDDGEGRPVLYIFGEAGSGKTFIAQYLRRRLEFHNPVLYFYFDSGQNSDKNTALAFFRTIIHQLLLTAKDGHSITEAHTIMSNSGTETCTEKSVGELRKYLKKALPLFPPFRVVIDALDECTEGPTNRAYVEEFISLAQSIESFRIVITSRPDEDILQAREEKLESFSSVIEIPRESTDADISRYIQYRLASKSILAKKIKKKPELRSRIEDGLMRQAKGVFLYARLVMDEIEGPRVQTAEQIYQRLNSLPADLSGLYRQTLERIQGKCTSDIELSRIVDIFHWVITAHRPLTVAGLHMALRAKGLREAEPKLCSEFLDPAGMIRSYCSPLVEILANDTIRPVHYSFAEYFREQTSSIPSLRDFSYDPLCANSEAALTCVAYLSIQNMVKVSTDGDVLETRSTPLSIQITHGQDQEDECSDFLSYAVMQWLSHISQSEEAIQFSDAMVRFCRRDNPAFTAWIRNRASLDGKFRVMFRLENTGAGKPPSPLHVAAYYGLNVLSQELVRKDPFSIALVDAAGATPLHIAAEQGFGKLVAQFLGNGANPATVDENKRTPLHRAAAKGHLSAVESLLDTETNVDSLDMYGRTALFLASLYGKTDIAQILLKKGARPDSESVSGDTPLTASIVNGHTETLSLMLKDSKRGSEDFARLRSSALNAAARKGFTPMVKLLLASGIDMEAVDNVKQTALHVAATSGQEEVVALLLKDGAKVDAVEQADRTPLYFAAEKGHVGVVRQLLAAGANIAALDRRNQTVLFKPAGKGHVEVVEMLLYSQVDVKASDRWGRTALHWAACSGQPVTTMLLIEAGASLEAQEWEGRTPLHWTSHSGRAHIISILLAAGANTAAKDNYGFKPIHLATGGSHQQALKLLLPKSDVESEDNSKRTPLHLAAATGNPEIVAQLLSAGASVKAKDLSSQTALHFGSQGNNTQVIKLLLDAGCSAMEVNYKHETPLHLAASKGYDSVVDQLLVDLGLLMAEDRRKQKPADKAKENGHNRLAEGLSRKERAERSRLLSQQSPLHKAARTGDITKVREHLLNFDSNTQCVDHWGRTPLHWSAEGGHDLSVGELLGAGVDPDVADNSMRTAVQLATENGHEKIARRLLRATKNHAAGRFGTVLHIASENGLEDIVNALLHGRVNVNSKDQWGQTALHLAAKNGHVAIARLLLKHGGSVEMKDENSRTALHRASKKDHGSVVKELLAHGSGSNINEFDGKGRTALHLAAENGCETVVPLLLESGADEEIKNHKKQLALHLAAGSGNDTILEQLLRPHLVSVRDQSYELPIHFAAQKGNPVALLKLANAGSNVAAQNGLEQTPLLIAARNQDVELVELILERFPKAPHLNIRDYWGYFPLGYAALNGQVDVAKHLIDAGAGLTVVSDRQDTPLHIASENGHSGVVELLLLKGAPIDAALYSTRQTPLHLSAAKGFSNISRQLLRAGANPDAIDSENNTPMHLAALQGHKGVVEELIASDARTNVKNSEGKSPDVVAEECGRFDILQLLSPG